MKTHMLASRRCACFEATKTQNRREARVHTRRRDSRGRDNIDLLVKRNRSTRFKSGIAYLLQRQELSREVDAFATEHGHPTPNFARQSCKRPRLARKMRPHHQY